MEGSTSVEGVARREELAAFLRARREALQPEDLGIPRRGRRRVQGLRRHEVADCAAVSVTWYTWLEQSRDIRTTPQVIDALARALLLDPDSHRHLRRLAGVPITEPDTVSLQADDSLLRLVDDLSPHPAHLMEPTTDLVAWNRSYSRLFVDPLELKPQHRNGLWIQLMCDEVKGRLTDWVAESEFAIARFRAEAGKYPGDPRFAEVISDLADGSELFAASWERHNVQRFSGHIEQLEHPDVGPVRMHGVQLRPLDHPRLTLLVHQLADEESRRRMRCLLEGDGSKVGDAR